MRILMPVDASEFSKAALTFVAMRTTLLKPPTDVELINPRCLLSHRVARAAGEGIARSRREVEAAQALESATARCSAPARTRRLATP